MTYEGNEQRLRFENEYPFVVRERRRVMPQYRNSRDFTVEEKAFLDEEFTTKPSDDWTEL
jgi:hypothetical protein